MEVLIQLQKDTIEEVNHIATIQQSRLDVEQQRLGVEQTRLTVEVEQLAATKQLLRVKEGDLVLQKMKSGFSGDVYITTVAPSTVE